MSASRYWAGRWSSAEMSMELSIRMLYKGLLTRVDPWPSQGWAPGRAKGGPLGEPRVDPWASSNTLLRAYRRDQK